MKSDAERVKAWRLANPMKAKLVRKNWLAKVKACIVSAKVGGCTRCGERDPACLDFHHIDPSKKSFNIGVQLGSYSLKRVQNELLKCQVLCANCHRKLHAAERAA